jgi:iduronate 2-sulfatase
VLRDPSARVRDHACHMFPRKVLGRAIRTERYRLVEWNKAGGSPDEAEIELYDYETDPLESRNHAQDNPEIVARLRKTLAAYPKPLAQGEKPSMNRSHVLRPKYELKPPQ